MVAKKSVQILDMIEASEGMRFTDIQRALWRMSNPGDPKTEMSRGYWCTNLCGGFYYGPGLLHFYCDKGEDGLWHRNTNYPHHGTPWRTMNSKKGYKRAMECIGMDEDGNWLNPPPGGAYPGESW